MVWETPCACASLCSVEHLLVLLGVLAGVEGNAILVGVGVKLRRVEVPEDEGARVHVVAGTVDWAPPAADLAKERVSISFLVVELGSALETYHDLATRQHDALVGPESLHVDLAFAVLILLDEVLHHRQALPAWNAVLARKRVEPAIDEEVLCDVGAIALDANSLSTELTERVGRVVSVLRTCTRGAPRRTEGVEDALEVGVPLVDVLGVGDGEIDVLEGLVRGVFAVEVVHDGLAVALTRPAGTDVTDLLTLNEGVATLPVLADLADGALRELFGPPLWALVTLEGLEGRGQDFLLCDEVVAPELHVLEQPGHVDVETLGTDEDWSGNVVGVSSHLRAVKAALRNLEPWVEAQDSGSEKDLNGVQQRGVTGTPACLPIVAAHDLEKVRLGNEVEDVINVLGIVVEVVSVLLVAERVCIVSVGMSFLRFCSDVLLSGFVANSPTIMSLRTRRASFSSAVEPTANCSFGSCPASWKGVSMT